MTSRNDENLCPIHLAILKQYERVVKVMIEQKASLDILTDDRSNILHFACRVLERLPKELIPTYVNHVSEWGTPLYRAAIQPLKAHLRMMELLLNHGADLEIGKPSHGTPLMGACSFGCYESVKLLLRKGAKTTCKNSDGTEVTAVEEAKHYPDTVSLIRNFEERGIEALDEPRPVFVADMTKVEGFMKRIAEE
ncbi:hypothetical protein DSL72_008680 [Monilinia vaccinii-corymbosi]|uniref:Uncharacterized protein n=1 Tax=Monilinia vaccinii-corymbosi TaxID=61207 RepID=A0A8A3PPY1_9HELO|nr:hypothetical protein DSL72_008680 [Monilinia vaccinii-corymbosi]